ncbi:hypothetical protein ACEW7V_02095 [Areca yellow leaf disease phytoplasma]|uniref:hypothetical protein n=1 Tax=Areca yellow leaf disease phytoplasma TaxID=927614 RepID=UPI0035B51A48
MTSGPPFAPKIQQQQLGQVLFNLQLKTARKSQPKIYKNHQSLLPEFLQQNWAADFGLRFGAAGAIPASVACS